MPPENPKNNQAVSEVVGEMLMISLVLILVAVFSASLADHLPSERVPSVTIMVTNDTAGNIMLWHKGGDWVKADSLRVRVFETSGAVATYTLRKSPAFVLVPEADSFDLESNITVSRGQPLFGNESVSLFTDRAILFSGTIGGGAP
jgi:FlaG/FlaF family flagellin (archaellin)